MEVLQEVGKSCEILPGFHWDEQFAILNWIPGIRSLAKVVMDDGFALEIFLLRWHWVTQLQTYAAVPGQML